MKKKVNQLNKGKKKKESEIKKASEQLPEESKNLPGKNLFFFKFLCQRKKKMSQSPISNLILNKNFQVFYYYFSIFNKFC